MGPDDSSGQPPETPAEPSINKTADGGIAEHGGIHAPESESSKRQRRTAGFLRNLEWISQRAKDGGNDYYVIFDLRDDHGGAESDHRPNRFVQFGVSPAEFFMDLPNTTLNESEAETILRDRPEFFFVNARRKSKDPNARIVEFDPLQREYVNGQERVAAEDMAYVLFDVWKLPIDVMIEVSTGRF